MTKNLQGTDLQANHLNQNAVYRSIIPQDDGLAVGMKGNAFKDIGTPHYKFHQSMEKFWDQYRKGGTLFQKTPTNAQYQSALRRALEDSGYTREQGAVLADRAALQQRVFKLKPTDQVPQIPGRINQAK